MTLIATAGPMVALSRGWTLRAHRCRSRSSTSVTRRMGRTSAAVISPMRDSFNVRTWATGQAAIFDGARIKYGVNVAAFVDPTTGQQRDPPLGPNAWWYLKPDDPNIETVVGSIEPGDVAQLQEVADRE